MTELPTVMTILATNIARAQRAYADSQNEYLPKDQKTFHKGRYESYLQNVAMICGCEVKDIRELILGVRESRKRRGDVD